MSSGSDDPASQRAVSPGESERGADEPAGRTAAPPAPVSTQGLDVVGHTVAGRYLIESPLGSGSIGRSYRAARTRDGQPVAVKLVHPELTAAPNFQRRLSRDVEAASQLVHRHIAPTVEHGIDDAEGAFICRELIDGDDLISAARRAPLTPRRVCELLMQLLTALSEAHRHGVLHRNLKPQNVFVCRDAEGRESVRVCDFGNPQRARMGAEYLAPEQADGGAIDGQADVYAVGVLLYELLTGQVPFVGASPAATLLLHQREPLVPPRERRPEYALPRELEAVCIKALAKAPRDRYRSPREMSQALRAVVALLGLRADEPLGSSAFAEGGGNLAEAESGRLTMPGEQLRSHTKFWLGAVLLAAVCIGVLMNPQTEATAPGTVGAAKPGSTAFTHGQSALESGIAKLQAGAAGAAVLELRNARRALGDSPELLRALGEALVLDGQRAEGALLLSRYLELEPDASDAAYVRGLIRRDAR
jgi:hypothetical protein